MNKPTNDSKHKQLKLHQYVYKLRSLVFNKVIDAARYFNINHGNISHYEIGDDTPPLDYVACLAWLADEWEVKAGRFDHSRRERHLRNMEKLIHRYYKKEESFLDWDQLTRAAEKFMQSRWGENWRVEADQALKKAPLGNLPLPNKEFLGYEQEIKNILDWLASHCRVVFIEGLDGVGKTWLANEIGNRCLTDSNRIFTAGIWISAQHHPEQKRWLEDVLNTVVRQLHYPHLVQLPLGERIIRINELLRRYPTLIIIDNFNTIEDLDLEDWIRQVPGKSKVIITSRYTHTTISSEYTRSLRLGGLTTPAALQFIRNHALAIEKLTKLASAPDNILIPLVEAVAGNPQLIKFALGELLYTSDINKAVKNAMQIEKIWEQKWEILGEEICRGEETYGGEESRRALMVTPFFADSMSGEALGEAAGLVEDHLYEALKQLERIQLLDIHEVLLQKDIQIRYSIHPTVRSFATNKLKSELEFEEQARKRWVTYFIEFAKHHLVRADLPDRYWNAPSGVGSTPIDQEWSNFKQVLRWLDEHDQDQMLVDLMVLLVHYMDGRALYPERIKYAEKTANAAHRLGQNVMGAYFRVDALGWILINERRFEEAFQQIDTGLAIAESLDNTNDANNVMTLAHAFRARAYLEQGNTEKAADELAEVISVHCSPVIRVRVGMVAGDFAMKERNYLKAIQCYKEAIDAIQQAGVGYESTSLHHRLGFAYLAEGDVGQAEAAFNHLLSSHQIDITIGVVSAEYGLARVAQQKDEISKAQTFAQQAHQQLSKLDADHELLREIEEFLADLSSRLI